MEESKETKYGKCRYCLTIGEHRDLMLEYEWNGTREVYLKIFLDCFNVFLSTDPKKSTLICTTCVLRLREASSFKKMVLEAERNLLNYNIDKHNSEVPLQNSRSSKRTIDVKIEDTDNKFECREAEKTDVILIEDKDISPKGLAETKELNYVELIRNTFCKIKNNNRTEKLAYIHNSILILENSNAMPFKPKQKVGFPCFYCRTIFEDAIKMREHQEKHTKLELKGALRSYGADNFVLYVDVTDLLCKVCNKNIENINELKTHLLKEHKTKLLKCPDRIVPFKLTTGSLICQICKCSFETFGSIERHMNGHYRNYVCEDCGTGFITKCRLKAHTKQHISGDFPCDICNKVYTTRTKLKNHIDIVHKMVKRFKCARCDERFTEYFTRQKHMVEEHGVARLEYKCNVCEKAYERKYMLSLHMKKAHLDQKDYQCEKCAYTCYRKHELKVHMIKHNGERIYECSVCKKSYARKKTLTEHMRIHNNDRRYACKACGQAFVQNCSLKGHMKTHHPELIL